MNKWNSGAYDYPVGTTVFSDRIQDLQDGLMTIGSRDSGTSDPSSGAPTAWASDENGRVWLDTTNERYGAGDDLGAITKRWDRNGAASYAFRSLGLAGWFDVSPTTNSLNATSTNTIAFSDLDLTSVTTSYTIRVLLQVEVTDDNGVGADVYAAFRKNGVTGDARTRRVYPQVAGVPTQAQIWCEVDAGQVLEYAVAPDSATGNGFDLRIDLLAYQERV